jgi:hypothetical protein
VIRVAESRWKNTASRGILKISGSTDPGEQSLRDGRSKQDNNCCHDSLKE